MNRQDIIKEGIHDLIGDCLIESGCSESGCPKAEQQALASQEKLLNGILKYLQSQGCVIKGQSLGASHPHLAAYCLTIPLVEE